MLKVNLSDFYSKVNSTLVNKPVNKVISNLQTVETSSLEVLNSYAKAGISFKGKKQAKSEISVQSLQDKLNGLNLDYEDKERLDAYFDKVDDSDKEALSFIDKVFSEPKLYGNKMITSSIYEILDSADFGITNKVVDKYLSNSKFYENEFFQDLFSDAIEIVATDDRFKLFDKFTDSSELYENIDLKQNIIYIIESVETKEGYKLTDKLLSTEAWYTNSKLVDEFCLITDSFTEEEVKTVYGIKDDADDSGDFDVIGGCHLFSSVEAEEPFVEENIVEEEPVIQNDTPIEQPVIEPKPVVEDKPLNSEVIKRRAEQKAESINERMLSCGFAFDVDDLKEALAQPTPSKKDSQYQRLMAEGKSYYTNGKKLEDME